ncbi:MAG: L,D-transpeptidase, partial [Polyangiaceae bacterium]|nr:L,D-transpeptidase [Polyangiaceae bacterium]
ALFIALSSLSCPQFDPQESTDPPSDNSIEAPNNTASSDADSVSPIERANTDGHAVLVADDLPGNMPEDVPVDLPTDTNINNDDTLPSVAEPEVMVPSTADLTAAGVEEDLDATAASNGNARDPGSQAEEADGDVSSSEFVNKSVAAFELRARDYDLMGIEEPPEEEFRLIALRKETWVYAQPDWNAQRLGYLRSGSIVGRDARRYGNKNCKEGWYKIEPSGYVCVGKTASTETHHPMVEAAGKPPNRSAGLPYPYVIADSPPPPRYLRLPSKDEQAAVEPDVEIHRRKRKTTSHLEPVLESVPGSLQNNRPLPSPYATPRPEDALDIGPTVARSGWGLLHVFSWTDRLFGVTTDLVLVPLDKTKPVVASTMIGTHFVEDQGLPVAFVQAHGARLYRIDSETKVVQPSETIRFREGFSLTGQRTRIGEHSYLETRDGYHIREDHRMVVVPELTETPSWATQGRKWIDVSITRQTLVAYEGMRPVFATMVSTGADGLGDPKETYSTVLGAFLIHTKHVTVAMKSDDAVSPYDWQDVPYVQFFHEGYALHGAYWHDGFGTPRSHGCINLSPKDAAWLFSWTDPEVPDGWHAKLQLRGGTLVHVHP